MKRVKSWIIIPSVVAVIIILLLIVNHFGFNKVATYFSAFVFSDEFDNDKQPLSTKNYEMLSLIEKQAYVRIFNKIEGHPEYIKIPKLTQSEFNNVFFAVKNDNPDILCFSDSCNMITFMSSSFLQLQYDYDRKTCEAMQSELDEKIYEIVRTLNFKDEYEAELAIHDYIISNCTYDESAGNASNAYGCLVDGEAVCSGYSRAAMILLNRIGINSILVGGIGVTAEQHDISHMWNIVWIDNEPYHLDVTWDDPDLVNGSISHMFFNLTTEEISKDHKDMSIDLVCDSDRANYFVRESLIYDVYNTKTLSDIMKRLCLNIDNGKNYLEFEFKNDEAYIEASHAIIDNSESRSDMYKIINYISDNATNKVATTHINIVKENQRRYIRLMFDYE